MPARRQRQSDACHGEWSAHGRLGCPDLPRAPGDGHRHDRNQQRRPERGERARPRRRRCDAIERKLSRSRPCRPSEATALTRPMASAPRPTADPARALPDRGREERAADAHEQAEIKADPPQPDQRRQRTGFRRRRGPGHGADRKHHRARHRMTILRDHSVTDNLRSLRQVVGQNDQHRLADRTGGDVARPTGDIVNRSRPASTPSLKFNCTIFGGCVSTLPSAGSEVTSVAWAHAALAMHSADSSAARPASRAPSGLLSVLRSA